MNKIKREEALEEEKQLICGRNSVIELLRSEKNVDKLYILDGCHDGPVMTIKREAAKRDIFVKYVNRERLDNLAPGMSHQGVIALVAAYKYSDLQDIFDLAQKKGEEPFVYVLDNIMDPHNLGAIIRTANLSGAHGVIIPKDRAAGLTGVVAKTSAGAINFTPVVRVTNIARTIEELKKKGMWFVCADATGNCMYDCDLTGSMGLVIGNEGDGVSRLVRDKCDYVLSIPMRGDIESLNASVAAGVMGFEILRQRMMLKDKRS